ncbi:mCG147986 [Mus musculus]|nr:mCG147986 [Mus musculus]
MLFVYMCARHCELHVYTSVRRPEVNIGHLPHLIFGDSSLTGACLFVDWTVSSGALPVSMYPALVLQTTAAAFYVGSGEGSRFHVRAICAL